MEAKQPEVKLAGRVWRSAEGALLVRVDQHGWMTQAPDLDSLGQAVSTLLTSAVTHVVRQKRLSDVFGVDNAVASFVVHVHFRLEEGVIPGAAGGSINYDLEPLKQAA